MKVFNFHGIGEPHDELEPGEDEVWVTTEAFERTLDLLAERDDIEITFDDGNRSDHELALPALKSRGLAAAFFVVGERIDRSPFLSTAQIRELVAAGMEVGVHGQRHVPWRTLTPADLEADIRGCRDRLAEITEETIASAACPFGSYGGRVLKELQRQGFRRVYTSDRADAEAGSWLRPRYTVRRHDGDEQIRQILATSGNALKTSLRLWLKRVRP